MPDAEPPSSEDIEHALDRVREVAVGFDELFTAMTTVQRHLLGLTRGLDAEAIARLEPGEATDLLGKLQELVVVLEDLGRFRTPSREITHTVRRPAKLPDWGPERAEADRALLSGRPLRRETVIHTFRSRSYRDHFPLLADLVEQLEREDALAKALPELRVADVLASMNGVGPSRAATVMRRAELPVETRFEELGPADVDRLSRTLHVMASGIPRDDRGGVAGGKAELWPKHAGPADYTDEEKAAHDAELQARDDEELASAEFLANTFGEALEELLWEELRDQAPRELVDQVRHAAIEQTKGIPAPAFVSKLLRWLVADLLPAVAGELELPLLRPDAGLAELRQIAERARAETLDAWGELEREGGTDDERRERIFTRWSLLGDLADAAKKLDSLPRLKPNYPRRRQVSPLRACELATASIAGAAAIAYTRNPAEVEVALQRLVADPSGAPAT